MNSDLSDIQTSALAAIEAAPDFPSLEQAKIDFLGKKGKISAASALMKSLPKEEKPAFGQSLNAVRDAVGDALENKHVALQAIADQEALQGIDLTLPAREIHSNSSHVPAESDSSNWLGS
jgi:phenylalanyl-tRNA synthetase alpha chain